MSQSIQAAPVAHERSSNPAPQSLGPAHPRHRYTQILLLLFFLTLPLVNPWVRGDGVGYYAYIRSLLVEHKLDFANDWRAANESFTMGRVRPDGTIDPLQYTRTGHLDNHFTVGPSMLWAPFLVPVHGVMLTLQRFGIKVQANGYSRPYLVTMALATALYGFLGLLISFRLACLYTDERWAFLATLGIWFASSLPVYMYFNPSWSHAHSVFAVAAFPLVLAANPAGANPCAVGDFGFDFGLGARCLLCQYRRAAGAVCSSPWRVTGKAGARQDATGRPCAGFSEAISFIRLATLIAFLPTLITRQIIYGHPFDFGYPGEWALETSAPPSAFSPPITAS